MDGPGFFIISGGPGGHQPPAPTWTDPAKYPRSDLIRDEECLLRLSQIERFNEQVVELRKEIIKLTDQMGILDADKDAQNARLFPRLRDLYPSVAQGYGFGWRKHESDGKMNYYVVGWDPSTLGRPGAVEPHEEA